MSQDLNLFDLADCLDNCANALNKHIMTHFHTLDPNARFDLQVTEGRLRSASSRLRAKAVKAVLTDLKDPSIKLQQAAQTINTKIASIAKLNEALNMIAKLLTITSEVLNVATNLAAAPAAIAASMP